MERPKFIPQELVEKRPEVFTEKTFSPVLRLARRFNRLLAKPPEKEISGISSFFQLRDVVLKQVGQALEKELPDVLSQDWDEDDKTALLEATGVKSFENIDDDDDPEIKKVALGLSLIAERARTAVTADILKNMPEEALSRVDLTAAQRDIMLKMLEAIKGINAEYLRHQVHTGSGQPLAENPVDFLRERNLVYRKLGEVTAAIVQAGGQPIFGTAERDKAFSVYLEELQKAYQHFEAGTAKPLSLVEYQSSLKAAQKSFLDFHTKFPDFPLIIFPAFSHYEGDEAAEKMAEAGAEEDWQQFGFDPEIRVYWQSKEQIGRQKHYAEVRDRFTGVISEEFPTLADTKDTSQYQLILGQPVASSGINIYDETIAQGEGNIILMTEIETSDSARDHDIFKAYLPDQADRALVDLPDFSDLSKNLVSLHEFAHGLYPESSPAADNLGSYDDKLAELKSDIAMWVTAHKVFSKEAQVNFGDKASRAMQLAMLKDALTIYRKESKDSEYFLSAREILEILFNQGAIIESNGSLKIVSEKLDEDFGPIFRSKLAEILEIYKQAAAGSKKEVATAKKQARAIANKKPLKVLDKLRKKQ